MGHTNDCDVVAFNQCKAMSRFDEQTDQFENSSKLVWALFYAIYLEKTANELLALIALPAATAPNQ